MNSDFPRILTLLRKERGISQKEAAAQLNISQALLSHYEKGIRECGLDFVVRAADFYHVSCDFLLGRSPERTGTTLSVEDLPEADSANKGNRMKGSILPTLNKKLITNSLSIIFDLLQRTDCRELTVAVSNFLMLSVYRMFRVIYGVNSKNEQNFFQIPKHLSSPKAIAAMVEEEATAMTACGRIRWKENDCCGETGTNGNYIGKSDRRISTARIIAVEPNQKQRACDGKRIKAKERLSVTGSF